MSLSDDGKGIDELKIRERAREKGLFTRPEEEYNSQEIQELIFSPGFTTNEQVTEYSGRGVGLDVVKNILEGVGGNLYIHTEFGRGTTFTIVVPLSLATMECIRFKVGSYRFSMPARHVFQFMDWESSREKRENINGRDYILYEDRMLPLIDLHRFYRLDGETPEDAIVIYMKGNEKEGCILVDSMYEQKRIVVKPLPPLFGLDFPEKNRDQRLQYHGKRQNMRRSGYGNSYQQIREGGYQWKPILAKSFSAFREKIKAMLWKFHILRSYAFRCSFL